MKNLVLILSIVLAAFAPAQDALPDLVHGEVQFETGRYGGWPANGGIWNWGDEIVTVFTLGYYRADTRGMHPIDRERPRGKMQARSTDGGVTWSLETPTFVTSDGGDKPVSTLEAAMDFSHPDFALMFITDKFVYSTDRCKTWQGPFELPKFGRPGLLARTDYIVNGPKDLLAFMATQKDDQDEGWVAAIRTRDGGLTWTLEGLVGDQPKKDEYSIMPSTVRLKDNALFSWIRHCRVLGDGSEVRFVDAWRSPDDGQTWEHLAHHRIDNAGNPPHMIRLADGRLAVTYGVRSEPLGIRGRISSDEGVTWGDEFIIRGDGGGRDLGYPRTVQRADGKCVTVYYFNDGKRPERFIAYTIWTPPAP
ncbi:MAG: exo-alpha-sialidase [Candidatus Hydrogenedentes bacterium]|nr:exo-alpha-sialidase [Candidatus Hydrogenedentota bacterium]